MKKFLTVAFAFGVSLMANAVDPALAASQSVPEENAQKVLSGTLRCEVEGGIGFIVGSRKDMKCIYTPNEAGQYPQYYRGQVSKWGLDIGATKEAVILWAVLGSTRIVPSGNLTGEFGGVSAEATVEYGLGANLLVGGTGNSYVLQPLSIQTQRGLNLAVGVTNLKLWLGQ